MKLERGQEVDIQEELEGGVVDGYAHNILYTCLKFSINKLLKVLSYLKKGKRWLCESFT